MDDWRDDAACKDKPQDWFFPTGGCSEDVYERAKLICADCDVRIDCLKYALERHEEFGIWGGLNPKERRRMHDGAILRKRRCSFCDKPFTFWWTKGKAPIFCGPECQKMSRRLTRHAWRLRKLQESA